MTVSAVLLQGHMIIAVLICHVSFDGITSDSSGQVLRYWRDDACDGTSPHGGQVPFFNVGSVGIENNDTALGRHGTLKVHQRVSTSVMGRTFLQTPNSVC